MLGMTLYAKTAYIVIANECEKKYKIPHNLLVSIMKVESSLNPYAIYGAGRTYNCVNKKQALDTVESLRKKGYKNINVGHMQINLQYHGRKFSNLEDCFNPAKNIDFAARFLVRLKGQLGSWKDAICYYHSGSRTAFHTTYMRKINKNLAYNLEDL